MAHIEVIPAFLASPGDVTEEREDARAVVQRVNTMLGAELDIRIELYGWEDQPPDYGRPQAQINPRVDDAELFIGLLWRRWGTPSGDGFMSGFEEEYRRAVARRESGDQHPRIWLFFKDVDAGQLSDPGPELHKVLAFRSEVQTKREVLYRSFSSKSDWREQLYDLLVNFLGERVHTTSVRADRSSPPTADATEAPVPAAVEQQAEVERSVAQVLEALGSAERQVREEHEPSAPDEVTAARVLLASFDWVSRGSTSSVLETHEANLLYRLGEQVDPTATERIQLMRSMVTGANVQPGWAWFTELPEGRAPFLLGYLARTDREAKVRRAALDALGDASLLADALPDGVDTEDWGPDALLAAVAADRAPEVQAEAMKLLGRAATDEAIAQLRLARDDPRMRSSATEGLLDALLRRDPNAGLRLIADERPYLPDRLAAEVISHAADYDNESLNVLRESPSASSRQLALRIADESGRLSEEDTAWALDDSNADVRVLAIDLRLKHGWTVGEEMLKKASASITLASRTLLGGEDADRMVKHHRTLCEEELRSEVNWYFPQTVSHYEALGREHFDTFGAQVRRDLDDRFQAFREESRAAIEERFKPLDVSDLTKETPYQEPAFTAAALEVLAEHGTNEDRDRVLRHVNASDYRLRACALQALGKVGEAADAGYAVRVATETDDGTRDSQLDAAEIALALSPASANELLEAGDPGVVRLAVAALGTGAEELTKLKALLNHAADEVREAAVAKLASVMARDELHALLNEYLQQRSYFYNVVVWLDRLVFAPEPFRTRFAAALGI